MIATETTRALVIGYGNELRQDDGLGPYVANSLAGRWDNVEVRTMHQLTPELAADIAGAAVVIFIDASRPTDAVDVEIAPVTPTDAPSAMTHHHDPRSLLNLTKKLFGRAPATWRVTVIGRQFEFGVELSATAQANSATAIVELERLLRSLGHVTRM